MTLLKKIGNHKLFLSGIYFTVICIGTILILGAFDWPGPITSCALNDSCYCEHMELSSIIRQPVNTWSNLLAVCLGLRVLWILDEEGEKIEKNNIDVSKYTNPMLYNTRTSQVYGILMIFVGTGAMFFHASGTEYGGLLDNVSMQTFVSFVIIYNFQRIFKFSEKTLFTIWGGLNIFMAVTVKIPGLSVGGMYLGHFYFGVMIFLVIFLEPIYFGLSHLSSTYKLRIKFRRNMLLYLYGFLSILFAYIFWIYSTSVGDPLCFPNWPRSLLQGHAFWHYLAAIATLFIFYFLRSEKSLE